LEHLFDGRTVVDGNPRSRFLSLWLLSSLGLLEIGGVEDFDLELVLFRELDAGRALVFLRFQPLRLTLPDSLPNTLTLLLPILSLLHAPHLRSLHHDRVFRSRLFLSLAVPFAALFLPSFFLLLRVPPSLFIHILRHFLAVFLINLILRLMTPDHDNRLSLPLREVRGGLLLAAQRLVGGVFSGVGGGEGLRLARPRRKDLFRLRVVVALHFLLLLLSGDVLLQADFGPAAFHVAIVDVVSRYDVIGVVPLRLLDLNLRVDRAGRFGRGLFLSKIALFSLESLQFLVPFVHL
jgi:hypothetical protein